MIFVVKTEDNHLVRYRDGLFVHSECYRLAELYAAEAASYGEVCQVVGIDDIDDQTWAAILAELTICQNELPEENQ